MARKKQELTTDNILLENKKENKMTKDIEKYIDEKVNKVFVDEIDKLNKKLLREKRRKIIIKNIVIVILLAIIGFLVYLLYSNHYFDKYFNNNNNNQEIVEKEKDKEETKEETKKETVKKEPTLDELKDKYAHLLNNYVISTKTTYVKDFYNGKLTDSLKKYLALNIMDFASFKVEDDYQIISNAELKNAYEKIFDDEYSKGNFDYDGNIIRYVSMMDSYITTSLLKKGDTPVREIVDVKVNDNKVIIKTVEGMINDHKLYKISDNIEIENYQDDLITKYQDKLDQVTYTFKDNKLISLEK